MRRMTKAIATAACLSLLILQLSGAHVHLGAEGYVGVPETSYSHDHGEHPHHHEGHDYQDTHDVSLLDQTLTSFKIPVTVLAVILLFVLLPRARSFASPDIFYPVLSGRYTRWRPPLRAPPQPA